MDIITLPIVEAAKTAYAGLLELSDDLSLSPETTARCLDPLLGLTSQEDLDGALRASGIGPAAALAVGAAHALRALEDLPPIATLAPTIGALHVVEAIALGVVATHGEEAVEAVFVDLCVDPPCMCERCETKRGLYLRPSLTLLQALLGADFPEIERTGDVPLTVQTRAVEA